MAIKVGLTNTGFIAPTYEEWLDNIKDEMRSRFGDDISLGSNSTFGTIARMDAWRLTEAYQQMELVYYAGFYSTATDTALDRLGSNIDVPRKIATNSHVDIIVETDGEYLIQAGEEFESDDGIIFELISDVTTVQNKDGKWVGTGTLESEEKGSMNNVLANTITIVSNPDDSILSVTNPEPATGGQDEETDEAYRNRLIMENAAKEGPTKNGIKSALMNLPGVREVGFVDNDQDVVDKYGNPPYSVHIYVLGGTDQDIAQTLNRHVAAGVTLTGSKTVNVTDDTGNVKAIRFDSAAEKLIHVKVNLKTNDLWNTDSGIHDIKSDIVNSINMLEMGQAVYLTKLYPDVYNKNGVEEAKILIGTSKDSLSNEDVLTEQFEVPVCNSDNVEVIVNG